MLSDPDAVQALADTEPVVFGRDAIRALSERLPFDVVIGASEFINGPGR